MNIGPEMWYRDWIAWIPGPRDTGQEDECTRERVVSKLLNTEPSEDERCRRAFRATELERVVTELRRAAVAVVDDRWTCADRESLTSIREKMTSSRLAVTIAALNLMGISTLLPDEPPFDVATVLPEARRVYLTSPADANSPQSIADGLDALSGLIGEFHRTTIFLNGLRIESSNVAGMDTLALVAADPAIMVAFGETLVRKYVLEGWSLVCPGG